MINYEYLVSIHAPAWGATPLTVSSMAYLQRFQSTRPRGARQIIMDETKEVKTGFNPRARVGRDGQARG